MLIDNYSILKGNGLVGDILSVFIINKKCDEGQF